jgi:hypothetical protein
VLAGSDMDIPGWIFSALRERPVPGVTVVNDVSDETLCALYQHALALVFPSVYEGFGLPPLEAMAAGAPVIAFRVSSLPEVCGEAARYPARITAEALAQAMAEVASEGPLRAALIEKGRERALGFTWARTADATVEAYRQAVFHPSPRALRARRYLADVIPAWMEAPLQPAPGQRSSGDTGQDMLRWAAGAARHHPRLYGAARAATSALWRTATAVRRLRRGRS